MTGRRLYDLFCDARESGWPYPGSSSTATNLRSDLPVAWPFLNYSERRMWSAMARRIKGVKR